jgi:thiaminase
MRVTTARACLRGCLRAWALQQTSAARSRGERRLASYLHKACDRPLVVVLGLLGSSGLMAVLVAAAASHSSHAQHVPAISSDCCMYSCSYAQDHVALLCCDVRYSVVKAAAHIRGERPLACWCMRWASNDCRTVVQQGGAVLAVLPARQAIHSTCLPLLVTAAATVAAMHRIMLLCRDSCGSQQG